MSKWHVYVPNDAAVWKLDSCPDIDVDIIEW
jgi:hypothetical protein